MPLWVSKEFWDSSQNEYTPLELKGEIHSDDFEIDLDDFGDFGMGHAWLHLTFDQNIQWVGGTDDFNQCKTNLADFLNENMTGPYFVHDGAVNTRSTLSVVILNDDDVTKFVQQYPEWKFNADSKDRNASTLMKWGMKERKLKDPNLYHCVYGS